MSEHDREHWDARYRQANSHVGQISPPPVFAAHQSVFPTQGRALEIACGSGRGGLWLADRGLDYFGVDVSPVAIELARALVASHRLEHRCRFEVWDLDTGLPEGPEVDLLLCHKFREPSLDQQLVERLSPGGLLAIAVLSEVGARPGRFRARPGELVDAFAELDRIVTGEAGGMAWLIGRKRGRP